MQTICGATPVEGLFGPQRDHDSQVENGWSTSMIFVCVGSAGKETQGAVKRTCLKE